MTDYQILEDLEDDLDEDSEVSLYEIFELPKGEHVDYFMHEFVEHMLDGLPVPLDILTGLDQHGINIPELEKLFQNRYGLGFEVIDPMDLDS